MDCPKLDKQMFRARNLFQAVALLCSCFALFAGLPVNGASAADLRGPETEGWLESAPPPLPQVQLIAVDDRGKSRLLEWTVSGEWVFPLGSAKPSDPPAHFPIYRAELELPQEVTLDRARLGDLRVSGRKLMLSLLEPVTAVNLPIKSEADSFDSLSLVIQLQPEAFIYWVHSSCEALGIKLSREALEAWSQRAGSSGYIAVSCAEGDVSGDIRISVVTSQAQEQGLKRKSGAAVPAKTFWSVFQKPEARAEGFGGPTSSTIQMGNSKLRIAYASQRKSRPYTLTGALSFTGIHNGQWPEGASIFQVGLTGKLSVSYRIFHERMELGANIFGTLLPLAVSPAQYSTSRYLGVNGRVGYLFANRAGGPQWGLFLGTYYWANVASDQSYGIKQLLGPQIFTTLRGQTGMGRSYSGFVKYAPLVEQGVAALTNSELALGGAYQLSTSPRLSCLSGTLELSYLNFQSHFSSTAIRLITYSLGAQVAF